MSETAKFELIYWPIRGLGSAARACLHFNGVDFKDTRIVDWIDLDEIKDHATSTRARLVVNNNLPMANLPSLVLPDGSALTQTGTILRYIASLGELKPKNDLDAANISMVIDHLLEFHGERIKMSYPENALENMSSFFEVSIPFYFGTLERWMTNRKTEFVATNYISAADIFLVEQCCAFEKLKNGLSWMNKFPKLREIHLKITTHPRLEGYFEKEKATFYNDPTCAKWS